MNENTPAFVIYVCYSFQKAITIVSNYDITNRE